MALDPMPAVREHVASEARRLARNLEADARRAYDLTDPDRRARLHVVVPPIILLGETPPASIACWTGPLD